MTVLALSFRRAFLISEMCSFQNRRDASVGVRPDGESISMTSTRLSVDSWARRTTDDGNHRPFKRTGRNFFLVNAHLWESEEPRGAANACSPSHEALRG